MDRPLLAPLDTLELATAWSHPGERPAPAGSYAVYVRLDARQMPKGPLWSPLWDKPYRKGLERITGKRWRLRSAHRPLEGAYGPDQWKPGEIVVDRTRIVIPANMAPGAYDVGVALVRTPHYPNTRLADYLHDKDLFSGVVVGQVAIIPRWQVRQ
jgi:hypothetical protein